MSVEIAWEQNILVTDFQLLKSLLVVFGFGSQAFICGFSRQNINSVRVKVMGSYPGYRLKSFLLYGNHLLFSNVNIFLENFLPLVLNSVMFISYLLSEL